MLRYRTTSNATERETIIQREKDMIYDLVGFSCKGDGDKIFDKIQFNCRKFKCEKLT
jgi:hypothetical protein